MQRHIYFDSTDRVRMAFNASPSPDEPLRSRPRSTVRRWNTVWLFDVLLTDWIENGFHGTDISARPHPHSGKRLYESTDVRDEIYNLFPSLSLSHPFPLFSHFHTSPQLFLPSSSPFFLLVPLPFYIFNSLPLVFREIVLLVSRSSAREPYFYFSLSSIFAHSLMRHIVSCAGGNDDDDEEEKQNWTLESRLDRKGRRERRDGGSRKNNVLDHFLKPQSQRERERERD